jgi:hypothetical protein
MYNCLISRMFNRHMWKLWMRWHLYQYPLTCVCFCACARARACVHMCARACARARAGHVQSQIGCSPSEFKWSIYRSWVTVHYIVSLFTMCYVTYVNFVLLLHCLSVVCGGSGPLANDVGE